MVRVITIVVDDETWEDLQSQTSLVGEVKDNATEAETVLEACRCFGFEPERVVVTGLKEDSSFNHHTEWEKP